MDLAAFNRGMREVSTTVSGASASAFGLAWTNGIDQAIKDLTKMIEQYRPYKTPVAQLKGNIAEAFHVGSYNVSAKMHGSPYRAFQPKSNEYGSVDIVLQKGNRVVKNYSSKYIANGVKSAQEQSVSVFQKYMHDMGGTRSTQSFEEYCAARGFDPVSEMHKAVYEGQARLIPVDQFQEAREWLIRKIQEETSKRPEQAARYQSALDQLETTLKANPSDKASSAVLTRQQSEEITRLLKSDKDFDPSKYGISWAEMLTPRDVLTKSVQAGLVAGGVSLAIRLIPSLVRIAVDAINGNDLSWEDFGNTTLEALPESGYSFLVGGATMSVLCLLKQRAIPVTEITSIGVGTAVALILEIVRNSILFACGKLDSYQYKTNMASALNTSAGSLLGAMALGSVFPGVGHLVGSILGSVIGSSITQFIAKYSIDADIRYYKAQALYFRKIAAELEKIDYDQLEKEIGLYETMTDLISESASPQELNAALKNTLISIGVEIPWEKDFDSFMTDPNTRLVFS